MQLSRTFFSFSLVKNEYDAKKFQTPLWPGGWRVPRVCRTAWGHGGRELRMLLRINLESFHACSFAGG